MRSLFLHPEFEGEYFDVTFTENNYIATTSSFSNIPEERLPEEGYQLDNSETETITISVPKQERSIFDRLIRRHGWVAM